MKQVGLQTYSLRGIMKGDVDDALKHMAAMGFHEVELHDLYGLAPDVMLAKLAQHKLHARGFMATFERLESDMAGAIADAVALRVDYFVCPWIPHGEVFDHQDMERALGLFAKVAEALAPSGIRFAYHMHGYEFAPSPTGELFADQMLKRSAGAYDFEMDVYWFVFAGADPVAYLKRYPGRFPLLHLKDLRKGVATGPTNGKGNVEDNVPLGEGQANIAAVVAAARTQGARWFFLEDESSRALEQLPESLAFLRGL